MDIAYPASPNEAMRRRPKRFDCLPQNGDDRDQHKAEKEKIAPAIQSGKARVRVSGGMTAAINIVLPAPIAMSEKNNRKNAPRRLGWGVVSEGIVLSSMRLIRARGKQNQDLVRLP